MESQLGVPHSSTDNWEQDALCGTISANMGSILQYRIYLDSSDDK